MRQELKESLSSLYKQADGVETVMIHMQQEIQSVMRTKRDFMSAEERDNYRTLNDILDRLAFGFPNDKNTFHFLKKLIEKMMDEPSKKEVPNTGAFRSNGFPAKKVDSDISN